MRSNSETVLRHPKLRWQYRDYSLSEENLQSLDSNLAYELLDTAAESEK